MPKYDFKCESCKRVAEIYMNVTQFNEAVCNECGGVMRRQFPTSVNFHVHWIKPKVKKKMNKMGV